MLINIFGSFSSVWKLNQRLLIQVVRKDKSQMKDKFIERVVKQCVLIHSPDSFVGPNVHCLMLVARESQLLQINY